MEVLPSVRISVQPQAAVDLVGLGSTSPVRLNFLTRTYSSFSPGSAFQQAFEAWPSCPESADAEQLQLSVCEGIAPLRFLSALHEAQESLLLLSLEDSPQDALYERLSRLWPSIVLFHDLNFSASVLARFALGSYPEPLYTELEERFGSGMDVIADSHVRGWGSQIFERSMRWKLPVEDVSVLPIVTSRSLIRQLPGARFCPIPVEVSHHAERRRAFREQNNIPEKCLLIGHAPRLALQERRQLIEAVVATKQNENRQVRLLTINEDLTNTELTSALDACDVFIGLKVDETRGVSYPLLLALGLGTPCIISAAAPCSEIPGDCALAVRPGFGEEAELSLALEALLESEELRNRLRHTSEKFILEEHSSARSIGTLITIVSEKIPDLLRHAEARRAAAAAGREKLLFGPSRSMNDQNRRLHRKASVDFGW